MFSRRSGNDIHGDLSVSNPVVTKFIEERNDIRRKYEQGLPVTKEEFSRFVPLRTPHPISANVPEAEASIGLPTKTITLKVEFNGNLKEWKQCGDAGVTWVIPEEQLNILQHKNSDGSPIGDLSKVIPIAASTSNHKSTLPFDVAVKIPGIEGNIYMNNGIQTPLEIMAHSTGLDNEKIECFRLDPRKVRAAELSLMHVTPESLRNEYVELPTVGKDAEKECLVHSDGQIAKYLFEPERRRILGIDEAHYNKFKNDKFKPVQKETVDFAIEMITQTLENIKTPYINHFNHEISLIKSDAQSWSEVDIDPMLNANGEYMAAHNMQRQHTVSFKLHYTYAIASGIDT
jgi:hypothetical protein